MVDDNMILNKEELAIVRCPDACANKDIECENCVNESHYKTKCQHPESYNDCCKCPEYEKCWSDIL